MTGTYCWVIHAKCLLTYCQCIIQQSGSFFILVLVPVQRIKKHKPNKMLILNGLT